MNSTVATSAMPMGMPGWPDFAFSTASMASARMALAMAAALAAVGAGRPLGATAAVDETFAVMEKACLRGWIACAASESM